MGNYPNDEAVKSLVGYISKKAASSVIEKGGFREFYTLSCSIKHFAIFGCNN